MRTFKFSNKRHIINSIPKLSGGSMLPHKTKLNLILLNLIFANSFFCCIAVCLILIAKEKLSLKRMNSFATLNCIEFAYCTKINFFYLKELKCRHQRLLFYALTAHVSNLNSISFINVLPI